jgi:hypothetical protein
MSRRIQGNPNVIATDTAPPGGGNLGPPETGSPPKRGTESRTGVTKNAAAGRFEGSEANI